MMIYVIADKVKCADSGFSTSTHRVNGNLMLLNEKEVINNVALSGMNLREKMIPISGKDYTLSEIKQVMKEGGWDE
ncbi:MAG: hypothetical protein RR280_08770 [Bacteroidaceae bacterium]